MRKIIITGALGQDGIILSKLYLKKKFKVFGLIKHAKKFKVKNVNYKINNLKSKKNLEKDLTSIKPDVIIHLASTNNNYIKRKNKENYKINYLLNIKITKNILDIIIEKKLKTKFIFAGSSLMFGRNKRIVNEKSKFFSNQYYGNYKIDSHKLIVSKKKKNNLIASTAILFNHDSIYRNKKFLIPQIINSFKNKNIRFLKKIYKLNISGDFSHAEDICYGIYRLSLSKKNIDKIILSSGKRFYINDIIHFLEKEFKLNISKNIIIKNKNNMNLIGSNKYAKKILNFKTKKTPLNACKEILGDYL